MNKRTVTVSDFYGEHREAYFTQKQIKSSRSTEKIVEDFIQYFKLFLEKKREEKPAVPICDIYNFQDKLNLDSKSALGKVYATFHEWGFKKGWSTKSIGLNWENVKSIMLDKIDFVKEEIRSYPVGKIQKTKHAVETVTEYNHLIGGEDNDVMYDRPFLPQAADIIQKCMNHTKDGIRMIAFLSVVHLGIFHVDFWVKGAFQNRSFIDPITGNLIIRLDRSKYERAWFVEVTLLKGSEEFKNFKRFLDIRDGQRRPSHWNHGTLLGFKNSKELSKGFACVLKIAGFPKRFFTLKSFRIGAVVFSYCQDLLEGISAPIAKEKLAVRPGYDFGHLWVKRVLQAFPETAVKKLRKKYALFSQLPIAGTDGVYKDLPNIDFMDGPIYHPYHKDIGELKRIRADLIQIFTKMHNGLVATDPFVRSATDESSENLLEYVSNKLFSSTDTLNNIEDKIVRSGIESKNEARKIITYFLVTGGLLRWSNLGSFDCPPLLRRALSNMQPRGSGKPQPIPIPFLYHVPIQNRTRKGDDILRAHMANKRQKNIGPFPEHLFKDYNNNNNNNNNAVEASSVIDMDAAGQAAAATTAATVAADAASSAATAVVEAVTPPAASSSYFSVQQPQSVGLPPPTTAAADSSNNNNTTDVDPALMEFLISKKDCFKVPVLDFHTWLVTQQDIVSMDDLMEACEDDEFVTEEMRNGGLKAFKKKNFIKSVSTYNV